MTCHFSFQRLMDYKTHPTKHPNVLPFQKDHSKPQEPLLLFIAPAACLEPWLHLEPLQAADMADYRAAGSKNKVHVVYKGHMFFNDLNDKCLYKVSTGFEKQSKESTVFLNMDFLNLRLLVPLRGQEIWPTAMKILESRHAGMAKSSFPVCPSWPLRVARSSWRTKTLKHYKAPIRYQAGWNHWNLHLICPEGTKLCHLPGIIHLEILRLSGED